VTEYRARNRHWSERSWWNPRRWLAAPLIVGAGGTLASATGAWAQMLEGGLSLWGGLAVVGTLVSVGAIAWAQSDLNYLKNRERNRTR
jgi:hypothetical protein